LHPGTDQRDQLAYEEEPEIAMPQGAERSEPASPTILRGNVAARLVNLRGFYFRDSIDDAFSLRDCSPSLEGRGQGLGFRASAPRVPSLHSNF
jgi:hypothetical protein